jgi:hypothetical protein
VFYLQTALAAHVRNPILSSAFHYEDGLVAREQPTLLFPGWMKFVAVHFALSRMDDVCSSSTLLFPGWMKFVAVQLCCFQDG